MAQRSRVCAGTDAGEGESEASSNGARLAFCFGFALPLALLLAWLFGATLANVKAAWADW